VAEEAGEHAVGEGPLHVLLDRLELYDRDRDLFKKYVPLCKRVAEAGWEPLPRARSSHKDVYVERFGDRYLTVYNAGSQPWQATITTESDVNGPTPDLVSGQNLDWQQKKAMITLAPGDVAVLKLH